VVGNVYDGVAREYERGRPGYAPEAVAHLLHVTALQPGATVLDLGAGTGKLTRMLDAAGLAVVAVDPSASMLSRLEVASPHVRTAVGTAEAIPLADRSVDVVVAAQAFHWFDAARALPEIGRVLTPRGWLALFWNRRDEEDPLQRLLAELTDPPERGTPRGWQLDIAAIVAASGLFEPVQRYEFAHVQPTDESALVDRLRSSSYVAALSVEERASLEKRLRRELERLGPPRRLAYKTLLYVAVKV
jgi:SAM-dependent methyltransferase